MTLNKEQDIIVGHAFMTAMARKLYRDGVIDISLLNRLLIKIDKQMKPTGSHKREGRAERQ